MNSKRFFFLKLFLSAILLFWIFQNGEFNLKNIILGISNYKLAFAFIFLTFLQLCLAVIRTQDLMQFQTKQNNRFLDIMNISWASMFINCVAPSTIFGELFRLKKLMSIDKKIQKDNALYTSILTKVFSVFGLILIVILSMFSHHTALKHTSVIGSSAYSFTLFFLLFIIFNNSITNTIRKLSSKNLFFTKSEFYKRRLKAFLNYNLEFRSKPQNIVYLTALSFLIQALNTLTIVLIVFDLNSQLNLSILDLFTVIPIGIFLISLPISISGLGVGHIAFSKLLEPYGITNGADIFTVYFSFSFVFNLIGIIPLLYIINTNVSNQSTNLKLILEKSLRPLAFPYKTIMQLIKDK